MMNNIYFYITLIVNVITTITFLISILMRESWIVIMITLCIISILLFLCTKHMYTKIQSKIGIITFKNIICILVESSIFHILYIIYKALADFMIKNGSATTDFIGNEISKDIIAQNIIEAEQRIAGLGVTLIMVTFLINLTLTILIMCQFNRNEIINNFIILIENFDITKIKELFFTTEKIEEEKPDVIVCKEPKTNKPVVLKYKDRFLHCLILGPTGSGKTSQTIIPFINQDMQKKCGITVIEPKGDLAEKVWAMGEHYGRKVVYFNPTLEDCPFFNPLFGKEEEVVENMSTTFKMLNPDSPQFFLDQNDNLIRNALKVLKRLEKLGKADANLINLNRIIYNTNGEGRKFIIQFTKLNVSEDEKKENDDIAGWFLDDYYKEKSKTYEHCSGLRSQVSKIISNKSLRKVLNPPSGVNDINFDKHLEEGGIIAISTGQGLLRDLGKYLGYFIILQFQSAVFKRPGNENTRLAHMLYIDEFQEFSNPGFGMMLTQGRSYRVASHLATQNRDLMAMGGGRDGQNFVRLVDTNARNLIIYPGGNYSDADYYSRKFGEVKEITDKERTIARKGIVGLNTGVDRTITTEESKKARFSPTEIMYRPFGEITYALINDNSIQPPGIGKIEYIPMELNIKLDTMIEQLNDGKITQSALNFDNNNGLDKMERDSVLTKTNVGVNYNISISKNNEKLDIPDTLFEVDKEIEENETLSNYENGMELDNVNQFDFEFEFNENGKQLTENNFKNNKIKIEISDSNQIDSNTINKTKENSIFIESDDEDDNDDLF